MIKVFAALLMTLDHIAVYCSDMLPAELCELFRTIGRAAAPMFMFALVNGAKHSSDRKKYLLRLYLGNLIIAAIYFPIELLNIVSTPPGILGTFFLTLLYICVFDKLKECGKISGKALYAVIAALIAVIPYYIDKLITENICHGIMAKANDPVLANAVRFVMRAAVPSLRVTEYTGLFVLMGVMMYYCGGLFTRGEKSVWLNKLAQCAVIFLFSLTAYYGEGIDFLFNGFAFFLQTSQVFMVLSILFILAYNGEKGRGIKLPFYIYYPLHIFLLGLIF